MVNDILEASVIPSEVLDAILGNTAHNTILVQFKKENIALGSHMDIMEVASIETDHHVNMIDSLIEDNIAVMHVPSTTNMTTTSLSAGIEYVGTLEDTA